MLRLFNNGELEEVPLQLSPEQQQIIEEAQEEYRQGKYLSAEQADKEIDEWLN